MSCEHNKNGCSCDNSAIQSKLGSSRNLSKLTVCNWLSDLPAVGKEIDIVEVQFKNTRKEYFQNINNLSLEVGDIVAVEASPGHDVGIVSLTGELIKNQLKKHNIPLTSEFKKIYRKVKPADLEKWEEVIALEHAVMIEARQMALEINLDMKIGDVEFQGDKTKAIFYYIADERVDFRQLIKVLAERFKIRVEMKQIGARQEAGRIGGIASCGRELCCSTWMTNFVSVTTNSARFQELSLNPQKLAGQCGKLKCCLNFELETYLDAQKDFPDKEIPLRTEKGLLYHQKTDVFKGIMWYSANKDSALNSIPVPIHTVIEIIEQNKKGIEVPELSADVEENDVTAIGYTNVVGQESLTRFDDKRKTKKRRREPNEQPRNPDEPQRNPQKLGRRDNSGENQRPMRENQRNPQRPIEAVENPQLDAQRGVQKQNMRENMPENQRNQQNQRNENQRNVPRNQKENPREQQRDNLPENQRNQQNERNENQRNAQRTNPRENPRDNQRNENQRNFPRNQKENPRENQRENLPENQRNQQNQRNENQRNAQRQNPRENQREQQRDNLPENQRDNLNDGEREIDNENRNERRRDNSNSNPNRRNNHNRPNPNNRNTRNPNSRQRNSEQNNMNRPPMGDFENQNNEQREFPNPTHSDDMRHSDHENMNQDVRKHNPNSQSRHQHGNRNDRSRPNLNENDKNSPRNERNFPNNRPNSRNQNRRRG